MFTMDDWLGLVILMVCIASAIALIVMFVVVGCVKLGCWLSDHVDAFGTKSPRCSVPSAQCIKCGMYQFDDGTCECGPIFRGEPYVPAQLRTPSHEVWPVECKGGPYGGPPIATGIDMGAGDDITTRKFSESEICEYFGVPVSLDSIIRDLHSAITDEHLEIRAHNRFTDILNRLEAYRDSNLPLPPQ